MPLSGISRWERVTQESDVTGAIAFDASKDGEPTVRHGKQNHPPIPGELVSLGWLRRLRRLRRGAGVLMPLSGISRRERVTQEIDVPGAIAFDTSEDGEPTARVEDERADCDLAMMTRLTGNRGEVPRDWH
jgi:hypothetical protein